MILKGVSAHHTRTRTKEPVMKRPQPGHHARPTSALEAGAAGGGTEANPPIWLALSLVPLGMARYLPFQSLAVPNSGRGSCPPFLELVLGGARAWPAAGTALGPPNLNTIGGDALV